MAKTPTRYPKWFVWFRNARDWLIAQLSLAAIGLVKLAPADPAIETTARLARFFGMRYPRTKTARENLRLAFPEKSDDEIEAILGEMWENLGRLAAEYALLDKIFDIDLEHPERGRFEVKGIENFEKLAAHDGPAITFTAHTGNWEVLPIAAATFDLSITALFRPPNNPYLARHLLKARRTSMGHLVPSRAGAAWALSGILEENGKVGLLADQYYARGPLVQFFGHEVPANPLLGKLARNFDCPVYPARCIRLPRGRYRLELMDPLELPRDEEGRVDALALTRQVNAIMEDWIREYPGQWLWLHRRWRPQKQKKARPSAMKIDRG